MSRSRPQEHNNTNPATRRFEWDGANGHLRYYDKATEKNVIVPPGFTFILLDRLQGIGGYNDASKSGIWSNEIRDTRTDTLLVKSFKGGIIAEGLYADIKARVTAKSVGGQFIVNAYIAFKGDDGTLALGAIRFKGASLGGWMDFEQDHRADLYAGAIKFSGVVAGKKGSIEFKSPTFAVAMISPETDAQAFALDQVLQAYLDGYFNKPHAAQANGSSAHEAGATDGSAGDQDGDPGYSGDDGINETEPEADNTPMPTAARGRADITFDDIPF